MMSPVPPPPNERPTLESAAALDSHPREPLKKRREDTVPESDSSDSEVPFSPLRQDYSEHEFYSSPLFRGFKGLEGYNRRQRYLRSYTFSRKESPAEKVKKSCKKLKAAAWAVMACNYSPSVARKFKQQVKEHTSRLFCSGKSAKFHLPRLHMPECLRMPQIS